MSGPTLAERLAVAVGVTLEGGDVPVVEAVERIVAERDALAERLRADIDAIATLVDQRDAARDGRDEAHERVLDIACALECKGLTPADHGSVHVAALRAARGVVDELRRSGAPDGLDVRRRVVWLREQLIVAVAERDAAKRGAL